MRTKLLASLTLLAVLTPLTPAQAVVMNGDFSDPIDLNYWTTEDLYSDLSSAIPSASVSEVSEEADLQTQGYASAHPFVEIVSLWQAVSIPADAGIVSFDIAFAQGMVDAGGAGMGFLDALFVSYFDDLDLTGAHDLFFLGVDDIGFFDPNDPFGPPPVPDGFDPGTGLYSFSFDISPAAGRTGILVFDLLDDDDGYFSSARVDNVWIGSAPEPGTWLLLTAGLAGALAGKRRRNQPRGA
jgi:hypothetical protein